MRDPALNRQVSDIFHPDWKPGKGTMQKARFRAAKKGIPVERALEEIVRNAKHAAQIALVHNARQQELAEQRREAREARRGIFPEPQSVRAVPTAIETNRRSH